MNRKIHFKSLLCGIVLGLVLAGTGVYAAIMYQSSEVGYDNTNSGLASQNVQDALDELYGSQSCAIPIDFATASWDKIVNAPPSQLQTSMEYGITRSIDLGNLGIHQLRIANVSSPSECSGNGFSQTACGLVIEFADIITTHRMNPYTDGATNGDGNKGGWPASEMRTYLNSTVYDTLPSDLKSKIINTTVVSGYGSNDSSNFTSTDKLYLLSAHEVWEDADGNPSNGMNYNDKAYDNTRQLDYYKLKNVTTSTYYAGATKQSNGIMDPWWLRSANFRDANTFFRVGAIGTSTPCVDSTNTFGVSPAFRIG